MASVGNTRVGGFRFEVENVEEMEQLMKMIQARAEDTGDSIDSMTSEFKQAEQQVKEIRANLRDAQTSLENMSEQNPNYDEMSSDVADLQERLEQVTTELKTSDSVSGQLKAEIENLNGEVATTASRMKIVSQQADRFAYSNAEARQSAMALGNIISDLPHGMMAVSNNVGELVEGFQGINTQGRSMMGILRAMAGPALLGGLLTGVFTLASRWDKVSKKIEQGWMMLKGMTEEQRKLNKAVDESVKKRLTEQENLENLTEQQQRTLLSALKRRRQAIEEAQTNRFGVDRTVGNQPDPTAREGDMVSVPDDLPEQLQGTITQLTKMLNKTEKARKKVRKLLQGANLPEGQINGIVNRLFSEDGTDPEKLAEKRKEMLREIRDFRVKMNKRGLARERKIRLRELDRQRQDFMDQYRQVLSEERKETVREYFRWKKNEVREQLAWEAEQERIQRNKRIENARADMMQASRELSIIGSTTPDSFERRRRMAKLQQDRRASDVMAEVNALQEERDGLLEKQDEGGLSDSEADRLSEINFKIATKLAERRKIYLKHKNRMAEIREEEKKQQERQQMKRLRSMQKFTGQFQKIGSALSSLYQTWRKQRVRELRKEGKSQKEINKQIEEEGRRRFERMKKIRIASAIANTVAGAAVTIKQTLETVPSPFDVPLAITQGAAAAAAGYAQVQKLRNLSIGSASASGGAGASGGGAIGARYKKLTGREDNRRIRSFAEEQARDRATGMESTASAIREEQAKTREAIKEGMAIGDDEAFRQQEKANDRGQKAFS